MWIQCNVKFDIQLDGNSVGKIIEIICECICKNESFLLIKRKCKERGRENEEVFKKLCQINWGKCPCYFTGICALYTVYAWRKFQRNYKRIHMLRNYYLKIEYVFILESIRFALAISVCLFPILVYLCDTSCVECSCVPGFSFNINSKCDYFLKQQHRSAFAITSLHKMNFIWELKIAFPQQSDS